MHSFHIINSLRNDETNYFGTRTHGGSIGNCLTLFDPFARAIPWHLHPAADPQNSASGASGSQAHKTRLRRRPSRTRHSFSRAALIPFRRSPKSTPIRYTAEQFATITVSRGHGSEIAFISAAAAACSSLE